MLSICDGLADDVLEKDLKNITTAMNKRPKPFRVPKDGERDEKSNTITI